GEAVGDNFDNAFRTVSREEVGIILKVTPQINEGGTVTLEIEQESSSVAGQILDTSTDLITNKRVITTTALVDDGDLLVIGGLIDQTDQSTEDKVPLLGDLPVAGNLFKTQGRSRDRRNLLVFLRPTIIRDRADAQAVTRKKFDYIKARELLSTGKPQSEMERLIEQVTGGTGPAPDAAPAEEAAPAAPEQLTSGE
ncbi:MAG TPA: type II secretion system protein GspD, partial [Parvularcula sp.]|nr:type II secretion system protein GspD [Parvularcula sp.]HBS33090.1 type II secretion system protein GspD [Parvularcula sp.]